MSDPVEEIRSWARFLEGIPRPRFDRIATWSLEPFRQIPAAPPTLIGAAFLPVFGVPVFVDDTVEPGCVEFRLGDELVERVRISVAA